MKDSRSILFVLLNLTLLACSVSLTARRQPTVHGGLHFSISEEPGKGKAVEVETSGKADLGVFYMPGQGRVKPPEQPKNSEVKKEEQQVVATGQETAPELSFDTEPMGTQATQGGDAPQEVAENPMKSTNISSEVIESSSSNAPETAVSLQKVRGVAIASQESGPARLKSHRGDAAAYMGHHSVAPGKNIRETTHESTQAPVAVQEKPQEKESPARLNSGRLLPQRKLFHKNSGASSQGSPQTTGNPTLHKNSDSEQSPEEQKELDSYDLLKDVIQKIENDAKRAFPGDIDTTKSTQSIHVEDPDKPRIVLHRDSSKLPISLHEMPAHLKKRGSSELRSSPSHVTGRQVGHSETPREVVFSSSLSEAQSKGPAHMSAESMASHLRPKEPLSFTGQFAAARKHITSGSIVHEHQHMQPSVETPSSMYVSMSSSGQSPEVSFASSDAPTPSLAMPMLPSSFTGEKSVAGTSSSENFSSDQELGDMVSFGSSA